MKIQTIFLTTGLLINSIGCVNTGDTSTDSPIEIEGTFNSEYNQKLVISSSSWVKKEILGSTTPKDDYTSSIVSFDNIDDIAITRGKELDYSGWPTVTEKTNTIYNREHWYFKDADTFYLCQEVYNKASIDEINTSVAADSNIPYTFDPANPDANNCGSGSWTEYNRVQN